MTQLAQPAAVFLAVLVIVAAIYDVATRRIPNTVTMVGICAGLALNLWIQGWRGLVTGGLGILMGALVFLPLFLLRGMGGGDVKLMAAIGAISGPANCFVIFLLTSILGGVMAVGLALWTGRLRRAIRNIFTILRALARMRPPHETNPELSIDHPDSVRLPYALAIAAGSFAFLLLA